MKICRTCQIEKFDGQFYIYRKTGALRADCKDCHSKSAKAWSHRNPEARRAINKKARAKRADQIKAYWPVYYAANRQRLSEKGKAGRAANPEIYRNRARSWVNRNPEASKAASKSWRQRNIERAREKCRESAARWKTVNKPKARAAEALRRANKLRATPSWADLKEIECFYYRAGELTEITGILHTVDHVVPLNSKQVCGLHCEANLQILPNLQNISKGNRWWPGMDGCNMGAGQ